METQEITKAIEGLNNSMWAMAALNYAAETGMLGHLTEPRTVADISQRTGVPPTLVERILDVLASLGFVRRQGETFAADQSLVPRISPQGIGNFLAGLRLSRLQAAHLVETAKQPWLTAGWHHTDPVILQSIGVTSSASVATMLARVSKMAGLEERLRSPSARFLDVGVGAAGISIAMCRALPNLRVVGIDIQDVPLAEARHNVVAAGLTDRIELRKQDIQDLADREDFDFAMFPQMFMPEAVVRRGLSNIWSALHPGGWVWTVSTCIPGAELAASLSRLQDTLIGGDARFASDVEAMLNAAGFISTSTLEATSPAATGRQVVGQRPYA